MDNYHNMLCMWPREVDHADLLFVITNVSMALSVISSLVKLDSCSASAGDIMQGTLARSPSRSLALCLQARAAVCCSMHFALIEMLLNPRSPPSVHLCKSWDQSNRSTRGQADTNPNPLVTNQNAHTSAKGLGQRWL